MSDAAATTDAPAPAARKRRALPVLLGLFAAVALGGGAFYAVYTGLILAPAPPGTTLAPVDDDFAHIPVEGVTITLAPDSGAQVLRFSGQIEVAQGSQADMQRLQPRFLDLINTYLRAVAVDELTDPAAIIRLRAQLLRRLQVVAGEGHVRDLLITEFILQ